MTEVSLEPVEPCLVPRKRWRPLSCLLKCRANGREHAQSVCACERMCVRPYDRAPVRPCIVDVAGESQTCLVHSHPQPLLFYCRRCWHQLTNRHRLCTRLRLRNRRRRTMNMPRISNESVWSTGALMTQSRIKESGHEDRYDDTSAGTKHTRTHNTNKSASSVCRKHLSETCSSKAHSYRECLQCAHQRSIVWQRICTTLADCAHLPAQSRRALKSTRSKFPPSTKALLMRRVRRLLHR